MTNNRRNANGYGQERWALRFGAVVGVAVACAAYFAVARFFAAVGSDETADGGWASTVVALLIGLEAGVLTAGGVAGVLASEPRPEGIVHEHEE